MIPVYKITDADLQLIFDALQVAPLPYIKSHPLLQSLHDQYVEQQDTAAQQDQQAI